VTLKGLLVLHLIISKSLADKIMHLDGKMRKAEIQIANSESNIDEVVDNLQVLHVDIWQLFEHIAKLESHTEAAEERVVELTEQAMVKPDESMEDTKTMAATPVMSISCDNTIAVCSHSLTDGGAEINLLIQQR